MKGLVVALLAVGVPLALIVAWRHWSHPPQPTLPPPAAASLSTHTPRSDFNVLSKRVRPAHFSPDQAPSRHELVEAAADWLTDWQDRARHDPDVQRRAAAYLLVQKRYLQAMHAFDRLLTRHADDEELLLGKAIALAGLDRFADALPVFEHLAQAHPQDATAQYNLAVALMRTGESAAAARAFARVLTIDPQHDRAMFNLAVLHQAAGQSKEAIKEWRRLTARLGANDTSHSSSAPATSTQIATDNAPPLARRSMQVEAWSHRGELALDLGLTEEAETCFAELTRAVPDDAHAWCNLGIARARQVRRDEATAALRQALQLNPALVPALNQLAYIQAANHADTDSPQYAREVIALCRRSLGLRSDQPNIRQLYNTIQQVQEEGAETPKPPDPRRE